ncbi:MAG: phage portal protein [Gammaproteobacteria bacterium]|nr:phage portal protein [Gammaproteobacteria bacterium]
MAFSLKFWGSKSEGESRAVLDPQQDAPPVEARASIGEMVAQSDLGLIQFFGMDGDGIAEPVTIQSALQVPAIWAAVNFLSDTLAALPIKEFKKTDAGRAEVKGGAVSLVLNEAANDETNSFKFRKSFWQDVFTYGRGMAFIDRNGRGEIVNLWPLEASKTLVKRRAGRTFYHYKETGRAEVIYSASEVLDIPFMLGGDRLGAHSPIYNHAPTIGLAQAVTRYGAKFFNNGGVPPFVISGPLQTAGGVQRAASEMTRAVKDAAANGDNAIAVPDGHTVTQLGIDPEKMQQVDVQRFIIEQVARIYGMPPAFLQDLTNGTFSNVAQQDLALAKHTIAPHTVAWDQEANLKLFGRTDRETYCETVLAGLLRGDFVARAAANASKINTGQVTINEVREQENMPAVAGGDVALVQGAMIPADKAGEDISGRQAGRNPPKE